MFITSVGCASHRRFANRIATPQWTDFSNNVTKYTELVDQLDATLGPLPDKTDAKQIATHKTALASAIRKARAGARQGDIFSRDTRHRFLRVIRSEVRGEEGKAAKKTIQEDNPNKGRPAVPLVVNAAYPDGAPLSTVPPTLLLRLPELPKTVEYRFAGKALVLHDVRANIIADYIPGALL